MGFFLKKFVSRFLFPVPLIAGLLLFGLLFLCSKRWPKPRPKLGKILIASGTVLYLLFHYSFFTSSLLGPIEYKYPAHLPCSADSAEKLDPPPEFILVFAQGITDVKELPVTSRINGVLLARIMEAVRLHRIYPDAKVIVSLCNEKLSSDQKRQWLDQFSAIVRVERGSIDFITGALDTDDEVNMFKKIVGDKRVIAVSSASHIPRIMQMMKRYDVDAVPAPCGHEIIYDSAAGPFNPARLFPSAGSMDNAETAIYERLGQLWEMLTGGSEQ